MPFPFTIKYKIQLRENFGPEKYPEILNYVKDVIVTKPATNITIENNELRFKAGSTGWNWNIMVPIERGIFELTQSEGHLVLTYQFFMYHMFFFTTAMSVAMGVFSQKVWWGVFCFCWLCGMNWVIALIRHRSMLDEIAEGINNLLIE